MTVRDVLLAVGLAVAFVMVAVGCERMLSGLGLVVGGVLLAVWSVLVLGDVPSGEGDGL